MLTRLTTMLPVALLVLAAAPASGHAETFCVVAAATDRCPNTDLQDALDAAAADPGADVVAMGTGTFAAEGRFHYEADDATNPVEIAGQGAGTVLRAAADGSNGTMTTLSVDAPGSLVRDLRVEAVADPQDSADAVGLFMLGGTVQDVAFGSDAGANGLAVLADGTTFRRIEVDSGLAGVAVIGATIEDSRFTIYSGIMAGTSAKPTTIRRSRIEAATEGIGAYGSVVDVHDTVVRLAVTGVALEAQDKFDYPGAIRGRHVTVVGPGAGVGAKAAGDEVGGPR